MPRPALLTITLASAVALTLHAQEGFREPDAEGPFNVRIIRVIEGDHFDLNFRSGPLSSEQRVRFRLSTVNTPSPHSDKECERSAGVEVRDYVTEFVRGQRIRARNVRQGRNSFEQVGRLEVGGQDLGEHLLEKGMAVPYNDSRRNPERRSWPCD